MFPMAMHIVIHYTVIFNKETLVNLWSQGSLSRGRSFRALYTHLKMFLRLSLQGHVLYRHACQRAEFLIPVFTTVWQCLVESLSQWHQTLLRRVSGHAGQTAMVSFRLTHLRMCLDLAIMAPYYTSASFIAVILEFSGIHMLGRRAVSEHS